MTKSSTFNTVARLQPARSEHAQDRIVVIPTTKLHVEFSGFKYRGDRFQASIRDAKQRVHVTGGAHDGMYGERECADDQIVDFLASQNLSDIEKEERRLPRSL